MCFALSPGASAAVGSVNQVSGTTVNDFTNPVTYIVKAADGSTQNWTVTVSVAARSAKAITAFSLAEQTVAATINATTHTIAIEVAHGTNLNGLVSTFALSTGASAAVGSVNQVSGTTVNDFTNPVTYIVKAADGSTQNWTVTVSVKTILSSAATLTSTIGTVSIGGTVNETIKNIPNGTTLAVFKAAITPAAKATFEVYESNGVTAATTLVTGVKVIVTAEDGTSKVTYTVTVNSAPPSGGGGVTVPTDAKVSSTDGRLTIPTGYTGEVSLDNAIIVTVPADAADKELIITIEKVTDTVKLLANNEVLVTAIYEVLKNIPGDLQKAATITFTFDPASLKSNQRAAIFYYDETKKSWLETTGSQISGNHILVTVNRFTKFAVFAVSQSTNVPTYPTIKLIDIAGHWSESAIFQALRNGIVTGYPDGTFKPNHTVTRAEFTVMLMKALKSQEATGEASVLAFADATKIGTWAKDAIAQALQAGYITGYEDGTFRPDAQITRAEMAVMVARALGLSLQGNVSTDFADDRDIPVWAKASVAAMKQFGFMGGKGSNKFDPNVMTTRVEAVSVSESAWQQVNNKVEEILFNR
ncbi:S-layer homology domain-containing protein [Paenibacillus paeoniae]|nr:S-layer homology domain-containing protein [Paenibacillus paeoniae]